MRSERPEPSASEPSSHTDLVLGGLAFASILGGILCWPAVLHRLITLEWYAGNVEAEVRQVSVLLLSVGAVLLLLWAPLRRRLRIRFTAKSLFFGTVTALIALAFSFGAAEIACRWLHIPFDERWQPSENSFARFDPDLGWSYRPVHTAQHAYGDDERMISMHFDALGARVGEGERDRDPTDTGDVQTVIFVGGSVTMGHGVQYEESFPGWMAAHSRVPLHVVNLAVQGFGTDQSYLMLQRHLAKYPGAIVVYGFICDHVRRNTVTDRRLLYTGARFLGTKPRFTVDGGRLEQVDVPRRYEDVSYSRVLALLRVARASSGPIHSTDVTHALVDAMNELVRSNDGRLLVLQWPITGRRNVRMCGCCPLEGVDPPVLALDALVPEGFDDWRLPGDPHPTARAHETVARILEVDLLQRGWITLPATSETGTER